MIRVMTISTRMSSFNIHCVLLPGVAHVLPTKPFGHAQLSCPLQVPPFLQNPLEQRPTENKPSTLNMMSNNSSQTEKPRHVQSINIRKKTTDCLTIT